MNIRTKNKIIKKVITPVLDQQGFRIDPTSTEDITWDYFRKVAGNIIQIISIYDNGFYLNMSFSTTVPMQTEYKAADLNGGSIYDSVAGYPYNDEAEFEDLINQFKMIILNKGINLLNELSNIKEKPYVSDPKYKKLEQIQQVISEAFRKEYGNRDFLQIFEEICKKLNGLMSKEYSECEEELIATVAEYGEWLIMTYGGEWYWDKKFFLIKNCGKLQAVDPMATCFRFWENKYKIDYLALYRDQERELK